MSELFRSNRYSSIAYQYLNVVSESGDELSCECLFCGSVTALYFNDVKGAWICFKCGEKGTAQDLVRMANGTYTEPEYELEHLSDQLRSLGSDGTRRRELLRPITEGFLRRFRTPGSVHESWSSRGFDEALCNRWELGYDFLSDSLTLPYRDPFTWQTSGIIKRKLHPGNGPRYLFPTGFARRSSLYGSWLLSKDTTSGERDTTEPVIITEGPTDAARADQASRFNSVAQYGSSISVGQTRLLHRLGVDRIILFYDYDRAGLSATYKSEDLASEFMVEKVRWNREIFCWHKYVCGCSRNSKDSWREHTRNLQLCPARRQCKCGRIHEPDPCSLTITEIRTMIEGRTEI